MVTRQLRVNAVSADISERRSPVIVVPSIGPPLHAQLGVMLWPPDDIAL